MLTIFMLDRGHVLIGERQEQSDRDPADALFVSLRRAAVVRRWGTNAGIGQLALAGPTHSTVLDRVPDGTRVNLSYVLWTTPVAANAEGGWDSVLSD